MNEKILVNEEGYEQFICELENLRKSLESIGNNQSEAFKSGGVGDGWHDNFAYEEAIREERVIAQNIEKMLRERNIIEIVKRIEYPNNKVNIGDTIKIEIKYSKDDVETETIKLTGKYIPEKEYEITLNSPIGKAIYLQEINTIHEFFVNGNKMEVEILEKL